MRARIIRICSSFQQVQPIRAAGFASPVANLRSIATTPTLAFGQAAARTDGQDDGHQAEKEPAGAMSRRLAEMTEDSIDIGGPSAAKNVEAASFSDELKKQLEARIRDSAFRSQNHRPFAAAEIPVCNYEAPVVSL